MKKFKTVLWWVSKNLNAILGLVSFVVAWYFFSYIEEGTQLHYAAMYIVWFLLGIYGVLLHVITNTQKDLETLTKKIHEKENE